MVLNPQEKNLLLLVKGREKKMVPASSDLERRGEKGGERGRGGTELGDSASHNYGASNETEEKFRGNPVLLARGIGRGGGRQGCYQGEGW